MRFLRRTFGRRSVRRYMSERDGGRGGGNSGAREPATVAGAGVRSATPVPTGTMVHIPAAGNSKSVLTCRVQLLDGTDVSVELPVTSPSLRLAPAEMSGYCLPPVIWNSRSSFLPLLWALANLSIQSLHQLEFLMFP
ncbi:hypothetical protein scyTo_0010237 [Scyliorhinus torazame]|uniref:Uncharacterized protein n=1 Tax=Scyliorhinus torazame TaxID=75743 RepID=A0A401P2H6_SCYTO|nr:hypothetical protein [Scyliorhinus torazame]